MTILFVGGPADGREEMVEILPSSFIVHLDEPLPREPSHDAVAVGRLVFVAPRGEPQFLLRPCYDRSGETVGGKRVYRYRGPF